MIKGTLKTKLSSDKDNAYLSRYLAKIITEVPIDEDLVFELREVNQDKLKESLEALDLHSLIRQLPLFVASFSKGGFSQNNAKRKESQTQKSGNNQKINSKNYSSTENNLPELKPQIISSETELKVLVNNLMKCNQINHQVHTLQTIL